jgi:predicted nucleic acid-binding Zn finger protein
MRNNLGNVQIAVTSNKFERIDGRKNINYDLIRAARDLRAIKSYYLEVECLGKETYLVSGGHEPHIIRRTRNQLVCDCGDYVHRGNTNCKHIRALNRPKFLVVQVGKTNWIVSDGNREYKIEYRDNTFFCECQEFHQTNVCPHLIEVLKLIDDYQFREVRLDLS